MNEQREACVFDYQKGKSGASAICNGGVSWLFRCEDVVSTDLVSTARM